MTKLHDRIYYAIIWRQNWLAMSWIMKDRITIERGLYRGAVQLLHHAVKFRNYSFARRLLKEGVNVDCQNVFGQTALQDAAQRGHLGGIKWLIQHGADFERQKDQLLLGAVRASQFKLIPWLIEQGCDINAVQPDGRSPLTECYEYCSDKEREKTAALLCRYGAKFPEGYDNSSINRTGES